jgi:anti-sigma factor RsiW
MIAFDDRSRHDEVWLLLPWLATGRLSAAERELAEEHLRHCSACKQELAVQHLMGSALTEPERVTYAPGPSFRKLMDRIDAEERPGQPRRSRVRTSLIDRLGHVSLWRPP